MNLQSKLCDAVDWFRPDVLDIINNELREVPRFHRKQWESAMIFLALRHAGKLRPDSNGLSMGGGKELILYALAPHVKQLVVTDLYDPHTIWDCAKTDDPDEFIRRNKPFPVDDERLRALRMDMRELRFPDQSFDFCYSTCAVEHIGSRRDFIQHFNEVSRVLKADGIYVFTTEVSHDGTTIRDEHNYVFSLDELHEMLAESNLAPPEEFNAYITPHKINYPFPSNLKNLSHFVPELFTERFLQESPHMQLMRGKHSFTCGIFIVRRKSNVPPAVKRCFVGMRETRTLMNIGIQEYAHLMGHSGVSINPFSLLQGESSRFFADHAEFFSRDSHQLTDRETLFHSDYFWFGAGERVFDVYLDAIDQTGDIPSEIELRVHRFKTLESAQVECAFRSRVRIEDAGPYSSRIHLPTDNEYCYAILAKVQCGDRLFREISIKSYPASLAPGETPAISEALTTSI